METISESGSRFYVPYRSNSEEWILRMSKAGIGVGLIPEYTLPKPATDINFRYLKAVAVQITRTDY